MSENMQAAGPPTPGRALLMLPIISVFLAVYLGLGTMLGIASLFGGFFFMLYWTGIKQADPKEFAPTLLGGLGGIASAYVFYILPATFGAIGMTAAILLIVAAVYVQIRELSPLFINMPFMLFLSLGTIPPIAKDADFIGMAMALVLAASYVGGIRFIAAWLNRRRSATAEPA
jgi:hypothetical protein